MLEGKTKYKMNEIVDLIDEGKADDIEARIIQKEVKLREAKYAKKLEKERQKKKDEVLKRDQQSE